VSDLRERVALQHAKRALVDRAEELHSRLSADPSLWGEYCQILRTLAAIAPLAEPGARGELLTTAQLADRLGLAPKTLLRHKKDGRIKPLVQKGKLLRWGAGQTL